MATNREPSPLSSSNGDRNGGVAETPEALAAVYRAQRSGLYNVALRATRSSADADDLVQEAFLRACERQLARPPELIRRWLVTVVRRLGVDSRRKLLVARTRCVEYQYHAELMQLEPARVTDFSRVSLDDLERAVAMLPQAVEATFRRWRAGESYDAIAQSENIPLGTVASRIQRAKVRLRLALSSLPQVLHEHGG